MLRRREEGKVKDNPIKLLGLCLFVVFASSFRDTWFDWRMQTVTKNRLCVLACAFLIAFLLSSAAFAVRRMVGQASVSMVDRKVRIRLAWLMTTAVVGLPTALIAILTALGSARASFIDYATMPVFMILVGMMVREGGNLRSGTSSLGTLVCIAGCGMIILSMGPVDEARVIWPPGMSVAGSLLLGVTCALTSALAGALSMQFARGLSEQLDPSFILAVKMLPVALLLLLISYLRGDSSWSLDFESLSIAAFVGLFIFLPLFVLYTVLRRETVRRIAPYFFVIPLAVFALNLFPFRLRQIDKIPLLEWLGMGCILGGLAVLELRSLVEWKRVVRTGKMRNPGT